MKLIKKLAWIVLVFFAVAGILYPPVGLVAVICMAAPVITAPFMGRKWCGSYCPRGSLNDCVLSKISLRKGIPGILKKTSFKIAFFIFLMGLFIIQIYFAWGSLMSIGAVFVRMILITTLIDILLGVYFHQRTWCAFCPMGTAGGWIFSLKQRLQKSSGKRSQITA